MSYQKTYNRIHWINYPDTSTPLNDTDLNLMDYALNEIDNRVIELDITKANQTDLLNSVASVTFNATTGILTVTLNNGTATQIDTGLAKLAVNFDYDEDPTSPHYQQLILQMKDGTYKYIDLSAMITQFEFDNTSTVVFNVNAQTGHISAIIPDGSITAEKLNPNVVVTMQAIEDAAEADALKSEGYAVGEQNGVPVGPGSPYYENNAKHYAEEAQGGGSGGHVIKDDTQTFIQRTGLKFMGKVAVTDDAVGGNTVVTVEAGGAVPHLIVISETGSTVTATKGTTVISATETSPEHFECDLEMDDPQNIYGVWVIDAILAGDDAQVSLNVDTIKVYTVDDSHFHADITVTYPDGATVSCSKTGEQTMYATGSPYTFTVHSAGIWTITGTRGEATVVQTVNITTSGQTEYVTLTIIPNGKTVTPTDDIQTLLKCADIWDKTSYTTIADLIADDTSLLTVLTDDNAIDYLVRSTTFASAITADEDAMAMIGSYDYASDTLLSDTTWLNAIFNSIYFESVFNTKVPTMTSNTTPSGEAKASSEYNSNYPAYRAFDGDDTSTAYTLTKSEANAWIGYIFTHPVKIKAFRYKGDSNNTGRSPNGYVQASNDGVTYTDLKSINYRSISEAKDILINDNLYDRYRIYNSDTAMLTAFTLQFYGRENGGVQSWLKAGGITDKDYTTLAEVLADTTTLSTLIADQDAVDYLVTAKGLINGIVADATAMSYIGLNNYCANSLIADTEWLTAIANSSYVDSVLNVKVPTMTGYTTPSGTVTASGSAGDPYYSPWRSFNSAYGNAGGCPDTTSGWINYTFPSPVRIVAGSVQSYSGTTFSASTFAISATNDGTTYTPLCDGSFSANSQVKQFVLSNNNSYSTYRISGTAGSTTRLGFGQIQLYGREDV